jgi:hypothetical protein
MSKSTATLQALLGALSAKASERGLTDTEWAVRAGLRKETLSRLRRRQDCDFSTLQALAGALDARLGMTVSAPALTPDGHFPSKVLRDYEEQLVGLVCSGSRDPDAWRALGPPFFMAGLAVMMASHTGARRNDLLALAERLHPGISEPAVFALWLKDSPVRPSRFLPMVDAGAGHAT